MHCWPGGQFPKHTGKMPPHGSSVVVVLLVVVLLVVVLLVVVAPGAVDDVELVVDVVVGQARQQLPVPRVPRPAPQLAVDRLSRHRSRPLDNGTRHAARFELPHVERAAHRTTACLHGPGSSFSDTSCFAARDTHWTWLRWVAAPSQGQASAIRSATWHRGVSQSIGGRGRGPRANVDEAVSAAQSASRPPSRAGRLVIP